MSGGGEEARGADREAVARVMAHVDSMVLSCEARVRGGRDVEAAEKDVARAALVILKKLQNVVGKEAAKHGAG